MATHLLVYGLNGAAIKAGWPIIEVAALNDLEVILWYLRVNNVLLLARRVCKWS